MTDTTPPAGTFKDLLAQLQAEVGPALHRALDISLGEAQKITDAILPDMAQALLAGDTKLTAELEAQIKAAALIAQRKLKPGVLQAITNVMQIGLSFVSFKLSTLAGGLQGLLPALPGVMPGVPG